MSIRRLPTLVTALTLAAAMTASFGSTALAATETAQPRGADTEEVWFQIQAGHSGKCLDVAGGPGSTSDGIPVHQWTCLGPYQPNQLWRLVETGDGNTYYIMAMHSNKCLDVNGGPGATGDGAHVQQWTCLGYAQSNQRWYLDWVGSNYYWLRPAHAPSKCLDVRGGPGATADGVPVQQYTCLPDVPANQKWLLLSS